MTEALCFWVRCLSVVRPLTPISRLTIYLFLSVEGFRRNFLETFIKNASWHCWKGFWGQRSKVKVTDRWNALFLQMDRPTHRLMAARPLSVRRRHADAMASRLVFVLYCILYALDKAKRIRAYRELYCTWRKNVAGDAATKTTETAWGRFTSRFVAIEREHQRMETRKSKPQRNQFRC